MITSGSALLMAAANSFRLSASARVTVAPIVSSALAFSAVQKRATTSCPFQPDGARGTRQAPRCSLRQTLSSRRVLTRHNGSRVSGERSARRPAVAPPLKCAISHPLKRAFLTSDERTVQGSHLPCLARFGRARLLRWALVLTAG